MKSTISPFKVTFASGSFVDVPTLALARSTQAGHGKSVIEERVHPGPVKNGHFESCQGQYVQVRLKRRRINYQGRRCVVGKCDQCGAAIVFHLGEWREATP